MFPLFLIQLQLVIGLKCQSIFLRKEIRELINQTDPTQLLPEGQAFIEGVQCLMNSPGQTPNTTIWDEFTAAHTSSVPTAHSSVAGTTISLTRSILAIASLISIDNRSSNDLLYRTSSPNPILGFRTRLASSIRLSSLVGYRR